MEQQEQQVYDARGERRWKDGEHHHGRPCQQGDGFHADCRGIHGRARREARSIGYVDEATPTLKASGGSQVPDIVCFHGSQDPISNTEHANAVNRNNGLENCVCQYGESAGTLTERHDSSPCADRGMNVVAFEPGQAKRDGGENRYVDDASPTIRSNMGDNQTAVASTKLSVRRLMPIECERLFGFPDNWTRIPWRGKPADECPDAPRYKACGNSMGVNCMRWIGLGIEAVEDGIRQKQQAKEDK